MNLRAKRTRKCIKDAFMELRKKKNIRKITVKELCENAMIHKSTFYNYYQDIYALSDEIEDDVVDEIISYLSEPGILIKSPKKGTEALTAAISRKYDVLKILFSDEREGAFVEKLENRIEEHTTQSFPDRKAVTELDVARTMIVHGLFHALMKHRSVNSDMLFDVLGDISEVIIQNQKSIT